MAAAKDIMTKDVIIVEENIKMFKFDEVAVNKLFSKKLDELLPGVLLMRPKRSKKALPNELGLKVIIIDRLQEQQNEDAIILIVRQLVAALAIGVAKLYGSTSLIFDIKPLKFEYREGEFEAIKDKLEPGTEVTVRAPIKEDTR